MKEGGKVIGHPRFHQQKVREDIEAFVNNEEATLEDAERLVEKADGLGVLSIVSDGWEEFARKEEKGELVPIDTKSMNILEAMLSRPSKIEN